MQRPHSPAADNPTNTPWAGVGQKRTLNYFRLALVMVGRYEDVLRNQSHQPEDKWNQDGYVIMAGSLAGLGARMKPKHWWAAASPNIRACSASRNSPSTEAGPRTPSGS